MKKLLVFLLGLLMSTALWAQQKTISGTVSDASGPLPGANVIVKGTTIGMVTSPDGTFTLDVPQNTTSLIVSFIGYLTQEVDIAGKTTVDVVLQADAIGLEEVVAIGYGTVKKSDLTGAVGTGITGTNCRCDGNPQQQCSRFNRNHTYPRDYNYR